MKVVKKFLVNNFSILQKISIEGKVYYEVVE